MRGRDLRIFRQLKGLTQADVGEALGVSATWVGLLERGRATPTRQDLEILGELFGTAVAQEWTGPVRDEALARGR